MSNTYTPNFSDPRVMKRIRHAYGYITGVFHTSKPIMKSKLALNAQLGQAQTPLSKFIKDTLLICVDHHYSESADISKKYIINKQGQEYIRNILMNNLSVAFAPPEVEEAKQHIKESVVLFDNFVVNKFAEQEYKQELETLEFTYTEKSNRLWHPIQNINGIFKKKVLERHGLKYHYDIRACAPTLIYQHAVACAQNCEMDEVLFFLSDYLSNRTKWRDDLTALAELTQEEGFGHKTSKIIINALFCGARLGNSDEFALSKLLDFDRARIEVIKTDNNIIGLRQDIKKCWDVISKTMSRRSIVDVNGKTRMLPVTSKQKWVVYFQLERRVLDAAREYMRVTNNKCFLEHDGWSTQNMIDEADLKRFIRERTGFRVEVDSEYILE